VRTVTYLDAEPQDLPKTGDLRAVGLRPQRNVVARETYCMTCGEAAGARRIVGRWDSDRSATALPFDPVAVFMTCGCVVGNPTLAGPDPSEHVPECNAKCDERSHFLSATEGDDRAVIHREG
jgi:hypothetical protein